MSSRPDDDLFSDSTMSFGEHLEELRIALFRSVIGIGLGFLIGLMMAPHVVRWIERPLKNGLRSHYAALAMEKIKAGEYGDVGPEDWGLLTQQHLIPQRITIDARSLEQELRRILPNQFPDSDAAQMGLAFSEDSLGTESAKRLLSNWYAQSKLPGDSLQKRLWQGLGPVEQEKLTVLADQDGDAAQLEQRS